VSLENAEGVACPHCGSVAVIKRGKAKCKLVGTRQRYLCKNCGRRFVISPYPKFKYKPEVVDVALLLLEKGLSVDDAREVLEAIYGKAPGRTALKIWREMFNPLPWHRWVKMDDGTRVCAYCGLKLTEQQYKRGRYPPCPNRPRRPSFHQAPLRR